MKKDEKKYKDIWTKYSNPRIFAAFLSALVLYVHGAKAEELMGFVTPTKDSANDKDSFTAGATAGEVIMLKRELRFLQGELIEVLEKYEALKKRDENLTAVILSKMMGYEGGGTEEAISVSESALDMVSEMSRKQSAKTINVCESLSKELEGVVLSDLVKFEMSEELMSLRLSAEKVLNFLEDNTQWEAVNSCDVLSVDDKLQIVILAVGMKDGVNIGDSWFVGDSVALKVVSVRPYVTATMLLEGKISDIAPGLKAFKDVITRTKK